MMTPQKSKRENKYKIHINKLNVSKNNLSEMLFLWLSVESNQNQVLDFKIPIDKKKKSISESETAKETDVSRILHVSQQILTLEEHEFRKVADFSPFRR